MKAKDWSLASDSLPENHSNSWKVNYGVLDHMLSDILHNRCIVSQNGNKTHFKPYYLARQASQSNSNMHITVQHNVCYCLGERHFWWYIIHLSNSHTTIPKVSFLMCHNMKWPHAAIFSSHRLKNEQAHFWAATSLKSSNVLNQLVDEWISQLPINKYSTTLSLGFGLLVLETCDGQYFTIFWHFIY